MSCREVRTKTDATKSRKIFWNQRTPQADISAIYSAPITQREMVNKIRWFVNYIILTKMLLWSESVLWFTQTDSVVKTIFFCNIFVFFLVKPKFVVYFTEFRLSSSWAIKHFWLIYIFSHISHSFLQCSATIYFCKGLSEYINLNLNCKWIFVFNRWRGVLNFPLLLGGNQYFYYFCNCFTFQRYYIFY